jgi:glucose-1-phosphate thymidylyltransferase
MELKGVVVVEDATSEVDHLPPSWPRTLEHIANRPIAHHVLDALQSVDVGEVIVATSSEFSDYVREGLATREPQGEPPRTYVEQRGPLDLEAALRLAAPAVGSSPCVVHQATGLLGEPLAPMFDHLRSDAPDIVVVVQQAGRQGPHLNAVTLEMLDLAGLPSGASGLSMAGVWLFGPGALQCLEGVPWQVEGEQDLTRAADCVCRAGGTLQVLPVDSWRHYAGDPLDLLELNRIALDRLKLAVHSPNGDGNRFEGPVLIDEHASVRMSTIIGPAVIAPGARIKDSYIGPYTSIGAGAQLEGAEIERSIIAAGASITHIGRRLVASVVGRNARICRDFSLPQAHRLRVGDGTEVVLC